MWCIILKRCDGCFLYPSPEGGLLLWLSLPNRDLNPATMKISTLQRQNC